MTARPFTLIHGDLCVDNLLFDGIEPNPEAVMLDWQAPCLTASVPWIWHFLIGGSEAEAERANRVTENLYLWLGELEANGVTDYSINNAKKNF
jgi:hypothetical protein